MAVKALSPLGPLPPWKICGMKEYENELGFTEVFDVAARAWPKSLQKADDRQAVPVCWSIQTAWTTWAGVYLNINDFAADPDAVFVDPQPRWGSKGALIRQPRSVIVSRRPAGFSFSPGRLACLTLATQLARRGVFCGTRRQNVNGTWTIVRCSLPEEGVVTIDDGVLDDLEVLEVDEAKTVGGDCLFIVEDYAAGDASISPYFDQGNGDPLPLVRAHDLDLLQRTVPRFNRVKYLYLQPFGELVTQDAKDAIESFIDDAPAGCVEYVSVEGALDSGVGLAAAQAAAQAAIMDFFDL